MPQFDVFFLDGTLVGRRLKPKGRSTIVLNVLNTVVINELLRAKDEAAEVVSTDGIATPSFVAAWAFIYGDGTLEKTITIEGDSATFVATARTQQNYWSLLQKAKMDDVLRMFTFEKVSE